MNTLNFEKVADHEIVRGNLKDADRLLEQGIRQTISYPKASRMKLRKATLPYYQGIRDLKSGSSTISDETAFAVYDELRDILRNLRTAYLDRSPEAPGGTVRQEVHVGLLTEASLLAFMSRARATQLDEVLAVSALSLQDHGGTKAHDVRAFYPHSLDSSWNDNTRRFRIQAKHRVGPKDPAAYHSSVVLLGYTGEGGVDTRSVTSPLSLSETLCSNHQNGESFRRLDNAYFDIRENIANWPDIRNQLLGKLAQENEVNLPSLSPEN